MSKASEFERLAKAAAEGEWTLKPAEPLKYEGGPAKGFPRYSLVAATDRSCRIFSHFESGWSPYFTAQFLVLCANNRDLITAALKEYEEKHPLTERALRLFRKMEEPGAVGQIVCGVSPFQHDRKYVSETLLSAIREVVNEPR